VNSLRTNFFRAPIRNVLTGQDQALWQWNNAACASHNHHYAKRIAPVNELRRQFFGIRSTFSGRSGLLQKGSFQTWPRSPYLIGAQLINEGIEIAAAFDQWVRISIGLPAENVRVRDAIKNLLG